MKTLKSLMKITGRMAFAVLALMLNSWFAGISTVLAGNVVTSGTSLVITPGSTLVSMDNLSVANGASIKNEGLLILKKNLANENALPNPMGTGTVEFSGTANQTVSGQNILQNLMVNNSSGITIGGNTNINGILTLAIGNVAIIDYNLLLGPLSSISGTPSNTSMFVATGTGELRKAFAPGSTPASFIFPVGDETGTPEYSPVTLSFTGGTFETGSYAGVKLSNSTYAGLTGNYLNRYWTLTQNGISSPQYSAMFQYLPSDVVGAESGISCVKIAPSPVTTFSTANSILHQLNADGATTFGIFTGAQMCSLAVAPSGANAPSSTAAFVSFEVTTGCNWTAASDQTWCTVTPSGTGNGTIVANCTENISSSQRTAIVTITAPGAYGSPQTVKVIQAECTLPGNAGPITGPNNVCQGQSAMIYTVATIPNATSYIWTLPSGSSGTSETSSITVNYGASAVSGNITVKGHNTCGYGAKGTLIVNVNPSVSSHFTRVWCGNGTDHMNINVYLAQIDGVDLEAGDEIGIFDGTLCVGSKILTEKLSGSSTLTVITSRNDGSGNGFTPGDAITYKLYDQSKSLEISNVGAAYSNALETWSTDGKFSANATAFVELKGINIVKQEIALIAGWNIFSAYVVPANLNLKDIFQAYINSGNLKKVMDEAGRTVENFGIFGGWKNSIGDLTATEGYKVNMTTSATLSLEGTLVPLPLDIPLLAGWNIISYPSMTAQDGKALVQSLIDTGKLIKVLDESGKTIENFGLFGGWKNNIGNFSPGKGYKVNVNTSCTLTIQAIGTKAAAYVPEVLASTHFTKVFEGNGTDHMNVSLVDLQTSGLQTGDEIGIFDGKYCVGSATIGNYQMKSGSISIPASANEGSGTSLNGFTIGNAIGLQLYRGNQSYNLEMVTLAGSESFEKNGSVFLKVSANDLPVIQIDNGPNQFRCYPNPFKDELTVEIRNAKETNVEVSVYNLLGQKIKNLYKGSNKGELMLKWNGTNGSGHKVVPGVYLVKMNGQAIKIVYKH